MPKILVIHGAGEGEMNDSRIAPVFQILAEDIHALGVRTVFGLMSDDTAVFAVTLDGLGVKFVGARHERNVVYDAGNFLGILPYLTVPTPDHLKMTSEFASIGLGFGTALGVAKGRPRVPTVLVIGDGGFLMTMSELETVSREDIPLIIVLMNDCAYGAELHFLALRKLPVGKSVFPDVEFAAVAEAFGFQAYTIRSLDDLRALGPVLGKPDGPILLDCKVNADIAAPFMGEFAEFEARQHG